MMIHDKEIRDDAEDLTPFDFLVLHYTEDPIYKTNLMHRIVKEHGDVIEHAPYIYGEYSDDIDEAVNSLLSWGAIRSKPRLVRTDYGERLYQCLIENREQWDEDMNAMIDRIIPVTAKEGEQ